MVANCKMCTIGLKLLSVNCVFVVFLVSKQTAVLIIIFSASKQTASHPLGETGEGVKIHMKKCLFHVSRHITNLFLETKNMRKQ